MVRPGRLALALTFAVLALLGGIAQACPACAGRSEGSKLVPYLIASLVLFPFAVVFIVHRIIKRAPPGFDPRVER
jgi:hypothetical protein